MFDPRIAKHTLLVSLTLLLVACSGANAENGDMAQANAIVKEASTSQDVANDMKQAVKSGDQAALTTAIENNINDIDAQMDNYEKQYEKEEREDKQDSDHQAKLDMDTELSKFGEPTMKLPGDQR